MPCSLACVYNNDLPILKLTLSLTLSLSLSHTHTDAENTLQHVPRLLGVLYKKHGEAKETVNHGIHGYHSSSSHGSIMGVLSLPYVSLIIAYTTHRCPTCCAYDGLKNKQKYNMH
jgi:hypothetical protein